MFANGFHGRRRAARFLLPALVGAALLLTGCTDKVVEQALGDPAPTINAGEQSATGVVAEFDQDTGRVALPNDVVLLALNAELTAEGKTALTGTARTLPIRIPFSGPISYPFASSDPATLNLGDTATLAAVTAWGNSLFLLNTAGGAPIPALPYYAGGGFKAVYQDANNDLVLVPGDTQLSTNTTYAVVVTTGVKDLSGQSVGSDPAFALVSQTGALVDNGGHSTSPLLSDSQAAQLEQLRLGFNPLFAALGAASIPRSDVALLFTFTVEATDSVAGTAALVAGIDGSGALTLTPADIQWFTGAGFGTDPASAANIKTEFTAANPAPPLGSVAAIYEGYYPCVSALVTDGAGDYKIGASLGNTCPDSTAGVPAGNIVFLLSVPDTSSVPLSGIAVFQHGVTRSSQDMAAVANTLAQIGLATIAINLWDHGTRIYQLGGADAQFIRPDDPSKTVGYLLQSRLDIIREAYIAKNNAEIATAIGGAPAKLLFVGQSLGSIVGTLVSKNGAGVSFDQMLFNVPGGDVADIVLNGDIGKQLIPAVAAVVGQAVGSPELNATLLGIELAARHAVFAGRVDPLAIYDPTAPVSAATLVQEMTGDTTIANSNTELLNRVMALTTHRDGDGNPPVAPMRWIFNPANYTLATAGHGFLLDGTTTATTQAQTQMATYFAGAGIIDPSVP